MLLNTVHYGFHEFSDGLTPNSLASVRVLQRVAIDAT